jgi:hypothetical protein
VMRTTTKIVVMRVTEVDESTFRSLLVLGSTGAWIWDGVGYLWDDSGLGYDRDEGIDL